ncbi:hypothetical protein COLO4_09441 [Corchorus olitorius]|uniref:Uncharacterized protein n=1 Tax=Corchorus olitorius TaxID=93759 RepID=A0A1R3KC26_9ROSI|nr:hypothetical protein COLO4_09441 [Corchorus olitorius]
MGSFKEPWKGSWHTLPVDACEAVSSLIFAASRCGELPELHLLRSLFKKRYGCQFELANVELRPGNIVNVQIKQNLCVNSVPVTTKQKLINEIAKDFDLPLVFQDPKLQGSEQKAEVLDLEIHDANSEASSTRTSWDNSEIKRKDIRYCKPLAAFPSQSHVHLNGYYCSSQIKKSATFVDKQQEISSTRTSLDSSTPQVYETSIDYLDDLELKKDGRYEYYAMRHSMMKSVTPEPRYNNSSMEDHIRRKNYKALADSRLSLDGSLDKWKAKEGNSSSSSHVHPNLPEYDDFVARLKDLKAELEYRQQKNSFSFFKIF